MYNTTSVFQGDYAADLYREYKALLSIGITEENAENKIIEYGLDCLGSQSDEAIFWITFARIQWGLGRLSPYVKSQAIDQLTRIQLSCMEEKAKEIYHLLQSPMPAPKKLRKPTTHHCPWAVGSLLAYRIVNSGKLRNHPCFGKYALLRVVKIDRNPVSHLVPSELYDESMRVSVYDWIGDHIPEPKITESLKFIPIRGGNLWVYFNWIPSKNKKPDITLIDCDYSFRDNPPGDLDFNAVPYEITHCLPFDVTLARDLIDFL